MQFQSNGGSFAPVQPPPEPDTYLDDANQAICQSIYMYWKESPEQLNDYITYAKNMVAKKFAGMDSGSAFAKDVEIRRRNDELRHALKVYLEECRNLVKISIMKRYVIKN